MNRLDLRGRFAVVTGGAQGIGAAIVERLEACWLASADCSFSTGAAFDISGGRATY